MRRFSIMRSCDYPECKEKVGGRKKMAKGVTFDKPIEVEINGKKITILRLCRTHFKRLGFRFRK